ncbi:hypothetical protein LR392_14570 [Arthrobacter sp. AK04]|jgi:2-polyprenyl-6-methoxyphenol hydroxylase-like FAD-dependent oxidoreductase|uniref:hypothetical protein n=1 Tax=Arthrobacter sp. AK04 TaxID=2900048 RepID=UPI001E63108B|nr:hypothetical protein [Arthrobacter sp. AK04]MCD5343450.1 hypothetical protein [Arthrobacter sp. AK04]
MAWLLWPDGSLCDGFEGLAARHPSAALKDVAPGGCASVNGAPVSQVWNDEAGVRVAVEGSPGVPLAADVLIGADGIHSGVRAQVFGPKAEYFHYLGMRAAAFIATEPLLNERFRNKFVLTDTIDRMAGVYSLRPNHVAALMVYRDAAGETGDGHRRGGAVGGGPRSRCLDQGDRSGPHGI